MRVKYSTGAGLFLAVAASVAAAPCPPQLAVTADRVATLRSLSAEPPPPCRWIPGEELRQELDRKLRRDLPVRPELFVEVLVRLGLADGQPGELYRRLLDFYASQVLGFYEPDGDEMVLIRGPAATDGGNELVWAHELAHAAQQRRFHLPSRLLAMRGNGDAQRAASAVAEGEAMLVMIVLRGDGSDDSLTAAEEALARQAATAQAPAGLSRYFVADLMFPYSTGFSTVARTYRAAGWAGVDALLKDPPSSTAELLHPGRVAPGPPLVDGDLPGVPAGWEEVLTDTLGEWGLRYLLGLRLGEAEAGERAAAWDADRLRLIRSAADGDRWALAWLLRCRSVSGRVELEGALRTHLPALLTALPGDGEVPALRFRGHGTSLEVLAAWPAPPPHR